MSHPINEIEPGVSRETPGFLLAVEPHQSDVDAVGMGETMVREDYPAFLTTSKEPDL